MNERDKILSEDEIALIIEQERNIRHQHDYFCPFCNVSLRGAEIPKQDRWMYGTTHFGLEIGLYNRDRDITEQFKCPSCKQTWRR